MPEYPKILTSHEASTMVSMWNEYLRLDKNGDCTAYLKICQYEILGEAERDEDGKALQVSEYVNDKEVVGIEDGYFVGGALSC